jgi:hypothetical protein
MRRLTIALLVVSALALLSGRASAQSAIAGVVKDATGGALPGVTVEAASPALIERSRSAVTDGNGQYKIVDLRPGEYTVTFTLTGFSVVTRAGIQLPSAFTATVNAELKIGSLAENITVSGVSPVVDVQSSVQQTVVSREVLDAVPTARNVFAVGAIIAGTTASRPDVGGTQGMQQNSLQVHGSQSRDTLYQVDGMSINSNFSDGAQVGVYYNDGMVQDISYQTNALPAEVSQGGIRINMIPREGGNAYHGALFATAASGRLQANNFDDGLRARGMTAANHIDKIFDINPSFGGPIAKDRLWFFGTFRRWGVDNFVANTFNPDRSQALDDNHITSSVLRLTWQPASKHKVAVYYDKNVKFRGHRRDTAADYQFIEPQAAFRQTTPLGYTAQAKWTSTMSDRLLVETGLSVFFLHYKTGYQPEVKPTDIAKVDFTRSTLTDAVVYDYDSYATRRTLSSALTYVTGTHNLKIGLQFGTGPYRETYVMNGDQQWRYSNGVPNSVDRFNTPVDVRSNLNMDLGVYAQDQWTISRATINGGVRVERFVTSLRQQTAGAGSFVGARDFSPVPDVPKWTSVVPRLGLAYNLFGNGKTALKGSASKYMQNEGVGLSSLVNPMQLSRQRCAWGDANGDLAAQPGEVSACTGFSGGVNQRIDPDLTRPYNWEFSAGVQQEVLPQFSVSAVYYRRNLRNLYGQRNTAVPPSAYTPVTITDPLTGSPLTVFNQSAATRGLVALLVSNDDELNSQYDGLEIKIDKRFGNSATVFGGVTIGHKLGSIRNAVPAPGNLANDLNNPNVLINSYGYVDNDSTYQLKIAGTYPLPGGVRFSGALQSNTGLPLTRVLTVTTALVPGLTQVTQAVDLVERGSVRLERMNLLDLRFERMIKLGKMQLSPVADIYNVLNSNVSTSEVTAVGTSLGRPSAILDGRFMRLGAKLNF